MKQRLIIGGLVAISILLFVMAVVSLKNFNTKPVPKEQEKASENVPSKDAISVSAQAPGSTVVISSVALKKGGFVVVHENKASILGAILGTSAYLAPGTYSNLKISLDHPTVDQGEAAAVLYADNGNKVFNTLQDVFVPAETGGLVLMIFAVDARVRTSQ